MNNLSKIYLFILGLPKTIYFNFRYFRYTDAIKLPVIISHRVYLKEMRGKVKLAKYRTGAVKIGFNNVGIIDNRERTIWQVTGEVIFKGSANIGNGSKISASGLLIIGDEFNITAASSIVATTRIEFNNNVLVSWECLIMDTDFHSITNEDGIQINIPKPIVVGSNVWVGCRSLILKGSEIPDGTIVAAGSIVSKKIFNPNTIIAGNPAETIKKNVQWQV